MEDHDRSGKKYAPFLAVFLLSREKTLARLRFANSAWKKSKLLFSTSVHALIYLLRSKGWNNWLSQLHHFHMNFLETCTQCQRAMLTVCCSSPKCQKTKVIASLYSTQWSLFIQSYLHRGNKKSQKFAFQTPGKTWRQIYSFAVIFQIELQNRQIQVEVSTDCSFSKKYECGYGQTDIRYL